MLSGHDRTVTSVSFSPDQLHVLTGSQDGTAIIWMAGPWQETNRENLRISEHNRFDDDKIESVRPTAVRISASIQ